MKIKVQKLNPLASLPTYATSGSACFDIHATNKPAYAAVTLLPGSGRIIQTGLAFEIPDGFAMMVFSRSGHGVRDVRLGNCVGIIDSDYRGELKIKLSNDGFGGQQMVVRTGDRIAQAWIVPVQQVSFFEAEELIPTDRGAGGFGSTGV